MLGPVVQLGVKKRAHSVGQATAQFGYD